MGTFKNMTTHYLRNAHVVFLVYDITNRKSFENIENILSQVADYCPETVVKVLIGNKIDLMKLTGVTEQEGQNLATKHGMLFF